MKVYKLYYLLVMSVVFCFGQNGYAQSMTTTEKIQQVYGSYYTSLSAAQIDWYTNCIDRCSITTMSGSALDTLVSLSSIAINKKFNNTLTTDDTYDALTFNPLKYLFNFKKNVDQYFRFGSTNTVLKVAKEY